MQTPREILADIWTEAGGDPAALDAVTLDRRRAATAVVVPRRRRGAGHDRRDRPCRRADLAIAQRASAGRRGRYAPCRRRMPQRALSARRRQAAAAGLGRHRRNLQDRRRTLRAAAYQFSASPRRRLQGAGLQGRARRCPGRTDAMGRRGVRDRGLCRRRRGRDDALARRMVWRSRMPARWPNCRWSRSKRSATPRQNPGPKAIVRWRACACSICHG